MGRYNLDGKLPPYRLTPEQEFMRSLEGKLYTDGEWQRIQAEYQRRYGSNSTSSSASMTRAVRPFLVIDSQTRQPINQKPPLPGEGSEAFISWGKGSNFIRPLEDPITAQPGDDLYDQLGGGGFNVKWPKPKPVDEEPGEKPDITMQEVSRVTETVKIYDPDDDANYIEVKRITTIRFRSSRDGQVYRFVFNRWE